MDSCNADGLTSSMADDIFFVLQKCSRYSMICFVFLESLFHELSDERLQVAMSMERVLCSTMQGKL